jgi:hypothetical protein
MELTQRRLNRALLARQLLLRRSRAPLPRVLEQVAGLQAQYAPSAYIRLWSCLDGFRLASLTRALEERRAVQATLMRSTIHIVSRADYWPFAVAVRRDLREWWERVHRRYLGEIDLDEVGEAVRAALAEGPRRRDELLEAVRPFSPERPSMAWNGAVIDLVRVPPSGTWERRRADLFETATTWVGPPSVSEADALDLILTRYLGGFGPARLADAADWAGVNVGTLRPSTERLRLRRFVDEEGRELLDLPRAPLPSEDTPAPVRYLPTFDATLLVHARRTQILPERFRSLLFSTRTPQSFPSFLVDGAVAGRWRVERAGTKATLWIEPFEPLTRTARDALAEEGEQLARIVEADATSYAVRRRTA